MWQRSCWEFEQDEIEAAKLTLEYMIDFLEDTTTECFLNFTVYSKLSLAYLTLLDIVSFSTQYFCSELTHVEITESSGEKAFTGS